MLESFSLKKTDLLWSRESFVHTNRELIKQLVCISGVLDLVRKDSKFFKRLQLLITGRSGFPPDGRDIIREVFRLDAHFKLQRIHQLALAVFHGCEFFGKRFLTLCYDIFRRF